MELLLVAVVVAVLAGPPTYAHWWFRKQLRIRPAVRSGAPTWWLMSTAGPARLHRRLRRAAAAARAAASTDDPTLREMAAEAEAHAASLEQPLLVIARLGRPAGAEQRALAEQVAELEAFVARLANLVRQHASVPRRGDTIRQLQQRLDALEAAHAELAAIEARAGLRAER